MYSQPLAFQNVSYHLNVVLLLVSRFIDDKKKINGSFIAIFILYLQNRIFTGNMTDRRVTIISVQKLRIYVEQGFWT